MCLRSMHFYMLGFIGILCLPTEGWGWSSLYVNGRCRLSRLSCRATVGNAGGRGACCNPVQNDVLQCAKNDPCEGKYPYKWSSARLPLKWNFNPNNMPGKSGYSALSLNALESALKTAWNTWTQPGCSAFRHSYIGRTTRLPSNSDRITTIYLPNPGEWAALGVSGALAFATPQADSQGNIIDGNIFVNPSVANGWGLHPVPSKKYDFVDVLTHEIGHVLGLAHSPLRAAVMFFSVRGVGPIYKGLHSDDRNAICTLYPGTNVCKKVSDCAPCFQCIRGRCVAPSKPIPRLCKGCSNSSQCGTDGVCVSGPEGSRCLQKCFGTCCPTGYRCEQLKEGATCVPFSSACPALFCRLDSDCGTGGKCDTQTRTCRSSQGDSYKKCQVQCKTDADCGSSLYQCIEFGSGQKRCLARCSNSMCPRGFTCKQTRQGTHCLPQNVYFCPCLNASDCTEDRLCRQGLCIAKEGKVGDPCSLSAPCATELQCEPLISGNRCVFPCARTSCPIGYICKTLPNFQRICVKPAKLEIGEFCDGVLQRCKSGFTCAKLVDQEGTTACVETCSLQSTCKSGGTCNLGTSPRFCQCSTNAECGRGSRCKDLGSGGARVCECIQKPCAKACGNGVCEAKIGENCETCALDCGCTIGFVCDHSVCRKDSQCGDGVCEANKGETCSNCKADCGCSNGIACITGVCRSPFCGDGICRTDINEDCNSCPQDCGCQAGFACRSGICASASCGNGVCEPNRKENCRTCVADCACKRGFVCDEKSTCSLKVAVCGDGVCDSQLGENCLKCKADCGCTNRQICIKAQCASANTLCAPELQKFTCESGERNCTVECAKPGCGCSQTKTPLDSLPVWLVLLFLFVYVRMRPATKHSSTE